MRIRDLPDLCTDRKTVHSRQTDVEHQQISTVPFKNIKRLFSRVCKADRIIFFSEEIT